MAREITYFFFLPSTCIKWGDAVFSRCIGWAEVQEDLGSRHLLLMAAKGEELIFVPAALKDGACCPWPHALFVLFHFSLL